MAFYLWRMFWVLRRSDDLRIGSDRADCANKTLLKCADRSVAFLDRSVRRDTTASRSCSLPGCRLPPLHRWPGRKSGFRVCHFKNKALIAVHVEGQFERAAGCQPDVECECHLIGWRSSRQRSHGRYAGGIGKQRIAAGQRDVRCIGVGQRGCPSP